MMSTRVTRTTMNRRMIQMIQSIRPTLFIQKIGRIGILSSFWMHG